jgi:hypothetical protein
MFSHALRIAHGPVAIGGLAHEDQTGTKLGQTTRGDAPPFHHAGRIAFHDHITTVLDQVVVPVIVTSLDFLFEYGPGARVLGWKRRIAPITRPMMVDRRHGAN